MCILKGLWFHIKCQALKYILFQKLLHSIYFTAHHIWQCGFKWTWTEFELNFFSNFICAFLIFIMLHYKVFFCIFGVGGNVEPQLHQRYSRIIIRVEFQRHFLFGGSCVRDVAEGNLKTNLVVNIKLQGISYTLNSLKWAQLSHIIVIPIDTRGVEFGGAFTMYTCPKMRRLDNNL